MNLHVNSYAYAFSRAQRRDLKKCDDELMKTIETYMAQEIKDNLNSISSYLEYCKGNRENYTQKLYEHANVIKAKKALEEAINLFKVLFQETCGLYGKK